MERYARSSPATSSRHVITQCASPRGLCRRKLSPAGSATVCSGCSLLTCRAHGARGAQSRFHHRALDSPGGGAHRPPRRGGVGPARRHPGVSPLAIQPAIQWAGAAGGAGGIGSGVPLSAGSRRPAPRPQGRLAEHALEERVVSRLCGLCGHRGIPCRARGAVRVGGRPSLRDHVRRSRLVALPQAHRRRLPAGGADSR